MPRKAQTVNFTQAAGADEKIINVTPLGSAKFVGVLIEPLNGVDGAGAQFVFIGSNSPDLTLVEGRTTLATEVIADQNNKRTADIGETGTDHIICEYTPGFETAGDFDVTVIFK